MKIRDLMLDCMLSICLADGEINHQELQSMAAAYSEIMGQPADLDLLNSLAQERFQLLSTMEPGTADPFGQLILRLERERSCLDDSGREIILESAFRVACADGVIEGSEERRLRAIAHALDINEGVLELEILQFQREFAAKKTGKALVS
jgi:tellurite resistance protein